MQHDRAKCLLDAFEACCSISAFTAGHSFARYQEVKLLRSAVERQFEILGEAFSRLDEIDSNYRAALPEMGAIIGMRNRIIHGYDAVDDAIVWDAVQQHVPRLMAWLKRHQGL